MSMLGRGADNVKQGRNEPAQQPGVGLLGKVAGFRGAGGATGSTSVPVSPGSEAERACCATRSTARTVNSSRKGDHQTSARFAHGTYFRECIDKGRNLVIRESFATRRFDNQSHEHLKREKFVRSLALRANDTHQPLYYFEPLGE